MGQLTTYSQASLLKHLVGMATFSKPTTYIGLFSTSPTSTANSGVELSGSGYARVQVGSTKWTLSESDNLVYNNESITFPLATANWATIEAIGVFDASTAGNLLWYTDVTPIAISANEKAVIQASQIVLKHFSGTVFIEPFDVVPVAQYQIAEEPATLAIISEFDTTFGYQGLGSLKIQVYSNSASGSTNKDILSNEKVYVNANEKYSIVLQYYTTNSNLIPKVFVIFYDDADQVLSSSSRGTVVATSANTWVVSSASATAPSNASYLKIGIGIYSMASANLGNVWIDNIRLMQLD